ncbi:LysE family translocator [Shewanella sp. Scap07]|uniref:LysE family translocator n=1 Tax=Shewanella sp. Scap07 TaxID=2589987 RepID=UPI0015BC0395|nr:LysE family transporter [Shewanella sp. Scap07]QLE85137.1 LysE family translocator [Shewanella sp. Scap07]
MEWQLLFSLAIIHSVALMSPGPDFALVVKLASQQQRQVAIAGAVGIALAILIHCILSLTGISIVIQSSPVLFICVQLAGATYLGWMGLSAVKGATAQWRAKQQLTHLDNQQPQLSRSQGFLQGLYTNLLNPKALVFFITLFSAMITPQTQLLTKVSAALLLLVLSLAWFCIIALFLSRPNIQQKLLNASALINLLTGALFIIASSVIIISLATSLT